jgi:hypothetical protein
VQLLDLGQQDEFFLTHIRRCFWCGKRAEFRFSGEETFLTYTFLETGLE